MGCIVDIIVFGINKVTDQIEQLKNYHIKAYMDNDIHRCMEGYHGSTVIHPIEVYQYSHDIIVIADNPSDSKGLFYIYEKISQLSLYGIPKKNIFVFVDNKIVPIQQLQIELQMENNFFYADIFETVHQKSILNTHRDYVKERCAKRKLYIYGIGYEAVCLTKMLGIIGIQVEKYIYDSVEIETLQGISIIETVDLVYENPNSFFVLVADERESYGVTRKKLIDIGLREDVDFTYHPEIPGTNEPFYYDVTLSYSRVRETMEGFEIFGDDTNPNTIIIAVLGGSTTESQLFFVKGWVSFFAEYLKNVGVNAKIYCGGISGFTSTQELLKFERDVIQLSPDIVISYSGVNDLYMFPRIDELERYNKPFISRFQVQFIRQVLEKLRFLQFGLPTPDIPDWEKGGKETVFYGLPSQKKAPQFWVDNMRMIHALSQEFGIAFFSFFQPFRFNGYYKSSPIQEIIHSRRDPSCTPSSEGQKLYSRKEEVDEIRQLIKQYHYITDLSELFMEESEIYYDSVHVYERGNQIIARYIGEIIANYIKSKGD